jgi:hypothetical protein
MLTFSMLFLQEKGQQTSAHLVINKKPMLAMPTAKMQLDSRLPVLSYNPKSNTNNVNAKFGSRFDFVISPGINAV